MAATKNAATNFEKSSALYSFFSDRYIVDIPDPFLILLYSISFFLSGPISENNNPDHRQDSNPAQNSTCF